MRGAVLLTAGVYRINSGLTLASGVVLRGAGQDPSGATSTLIVCPGGIGSMITIGTDIPTIQTINTASRQTLLDSYVPVGDNRLRVANPAGFAVGDKVLVERPCTASWITAIGMDVISERPGDPNSTQQWYAGKVNLQFERTVTAVDSTYVTIDAPVVAAMEDAYGGGTLVKFTPVTRIKEAGIESLRLMTQYVVGTENVDQGNAGWGIVVNTAENCWVRKVTGLYFSGGTVSANGASIRVTVEDCANLDPVSLITGGRRYSFPINGQLDLVQRCYSRQGRHDFITGYQDMGTNVYLDCFCEVTYADSGPHNCWSTGILYDNITAGDLSVQDRDYLGSGQGWAGANHVLWNCNANIVCQRPPTANNWAIGCKGTKGSDFAKVPPRVQGTYESWLTPVATRSLYLRQLSDRLGTTAVNNVTTAAQRAGSISAALKTQYDELSPAVPWPSITSIANRTINANTSTGLITFTVGDAQTSAGALTVTGNSSNLTLVPNANIVFSGSGSATRKVNITPASGQLGSAAITVKVSDGALSASRTFTLSVTSTNAAPTITPIPDQITQQDTATGAISFIIGDDNTPPEALAITATSSNPTVIPNENIAISTPWTDGDIGGVGIEGSATLTDVITMAASGVDVSGSNDECHFLSQPMTADGEMVARVLSVENTDPWAKAGVMIRKSTASNSVNLFLNVTSSNGVQFSQRVAASGTTIASGTAGITAPCWLRLVKSGTSFTGYYATETGGVRGSWVQVGATVTIPTMTGTPLAGIASTSHDDTNLGLSTFDNVTGSEKRLVTVTPALGQIGSSTITLNVSDGSLIASEPFLLTVPSPYQVSGTILSGTSDGDITDGSPNALELAGSTCNLGDSGSSPYVNRCVIYVFQLPISGTVANPFTSASFTFNNLSASNSVKNCDLYGLGRRVSPALLTSDYYGSTTTVDTGATKLQTSIVTSSATAGLITTSTTANKALLNYLNAQYASGAGAGQYVFLRLNTSQVKTGVDRVTLTMAEGGVTTPVDTRPQINYTAIPSNNPPRITSIADQTIPLNSCTGDIPFTIGDPYVAASTLVLSATSSNTALVPNSAIILGGSNSYRTVSVTPVAMQTGSSIISITVAKGTLTSTETFVVKVDQLSFGAFAFLFNQDGNFEGWAGNATVSNAQVSGGALSASLVGTDPQLNRSGLAFPGDNVPTVLIRMKSSAGGSAQLFWGNEIGGATAARSVTFSVPAGAVYNWYAVDVASNANWAGHTIKSLRLDPPNTTGTVAIDCMIGGNGDFNQNGLDDAWEVANQFDPTIYNNPLLDSDGDGISNAQEYVLGTNPRVANSLTSLALAASGSTLTLSFTASSASGPGYSGLTRLYNLETSTALSNPASWGGMDGYTDIIGADQTVTLTIPLSAGPHFYRLKERLQ